MTPTDQPALRPSDADGEPGTGPLITPRESEVMVRFLDKSWRLCRMLAWQRGASPGSWWCLLRWGVSGDLYQAWYLYDPGQVEPTGQSRP